MEERGACAEKEPGGKARAGREGRGGAGAAQALLQSPWRLLSENRAAAQSHAGKCHQPPAGGRRLPVVPEGEAGGAGL